MFCYDKYNNRWAVLLISAVFSCLCSVPTFADRICGPWDKGQLLVSQNRCEEPQFFESLHTCPTPELVSISALNPETTLLLTPTACGIVPISNDAAPAWQACIDAHDHITTFLVTPGDYRHWGKLNIQNNGVYNNTSATSDKRVIRYHHGDEYVHAASRAQIKVAQSTNEAFIDGFDVSNSHNWILHGLTISNYGSQVAGSIATSSNIIVDGFLIENVTIHGIRVVGNRESNGNNCIQNNLIRNSSPGVDRLGVQIKVSRNYPTIRTIIVNNEIVNFGDAIQVGQMTGQTDFDNDPDNDPPLDLSADTPNTIIAENDLYLTDSYVRARVNGDNGCVENAIDLKNGAINEPDALIVHRNRIWGYRDLKGCGGLGEGIVIQCVARNVHVSDNILFNLPIGLRTEDWANHDGSACYLEEHPSDRGVRVTINLFYDIHAIGTSLVRDKYSGVFAMHAVPNVGYKGNIFAYGDILAAAGGSGSGIYCSNQIIYVPSLGSGTLTNMCESGPFLEENEIFNENPEPYNTFRDYTFWIKRWSGPERQTLPSAYPRSNDSS